MITYSKSLLLRCVDVLLTMAILLPALLLFLCCAFVAAVIILPYELFNSLENFDRAP